MQSIAMPTIVNVSRSLPDALVVLGASGNFVKRTIWPSQFYLHRDGPLPKGLRIIGATRGSNPTASIALAERYGHSRYE